MARTLLAAEQPVRAVVRDAARALSRSERRFEVMRADMYDLAFLTSAFEGTQGVFVTTPSGVDPSPGFPEGGTWQDCLRPFG